MQLDGQHPVSSTRNMLSRFECHGDSAQISRILEEAPDFGGTTIASSTRTIQSAMANPTASSPRVATSNKKYNNPLAHLATGVMQGLKVKLHLRPPSKTLPRLILGGRSMLAATRGASSRQEEGILPTDATTTTITTASSPSPPTSPRNPTPRILNKLASPSMMASKTCASGFVVTPSQLKS
jgi:hypothetical protein